MKKMFLLPLALTLSLTQVFAQSENKDRWDGANTPSILDESFEYKFSKLPLSGDIGVETGLGWSSSYWPSYKGGIAFRWNHPTPNNFKYKSPSFAQLKSMSQEQINQLSPAEKFDIYIGRYDYPLRQEAHGNSSPTAKDWAGICHGWSPAALHHVEPDQVTVTNPDGIKVGFGSSDIKGLMSYYYAFHADTEVRQVSKRCFGRLAGVFSGGCNGVNPGSLHVVITNMLGLRKTGFIADVDRWKQVWNQPVLGFKSVVVGTEKIKTEQKDRGVAKVLRVKTDFIYAGELNRNAPADELEDFNMWTPVFGTVFQQRKTAKYEYTIEIDNGGNIVGGDWISEERPDFLWTQEKAEFTDFFAALNDLYKPIKTKR